MMRMAGYISSATTADNAPRRCMALREGGVASSLGWLFGRIKMAASQGSRSNHRCEAGHDHGDDATDGCTLLCRTPQITSHEAFDPLPHPSIHRHIESGFFFFARSLMVVVPSHPAFTPIDNINYRSAGIWRMGNVTKYFPLHLPTVPALHQQNPPTITTRFTNQASSATGFDLLY